MVQVTANPAMKETDPYLETFERFEAQAKQPAWVFPLRKAGIARFAELGFPTLQQEDWRFTNVAPIAKLPFKPVFQVVARRPHPGSHRRVHLRQAGRQPAGVRQRPLRGRNCRSPGPQPQGVVVSSLAAALAGDSGLIKEHLARYAARRGQPVCGAQRGLLPGRRLGLCSRGQAPGGAGAPAVHLDGEGGRGHGASAQPDHRRKGQPGDGARKLCQHRRRRLISRTR